MTSLKALQNKAAKIILDRPLYSSAMHALATQPANGRRVSLLSSPLRDVSRETSLSGDERGETSAVRRLLATLKRVPLEKRRFQRRCIYVYKCLNGLVEHDMTFIRQQEQHDYNTRTKLNLRLPSVKRNWGKQRTAFHAIKDFNSLSQAIRQSVNLNIFKRNSFKFVI